MVIFSAGSWSVFLMNGLAKDVDMLITFGENIKGGITAS